IEVNEKVPDKFVEIGKAIAPTFGGINLEDIASPAFFHIEERLIKELDIPVMHDDQHGTAIISAAALINATMLTHKEMHNLRVVVIGAGAAAISCARIYKQLGVGEILMFDSRGLVNDTRTDLNAIKKEFISHEKFATFKEALKGADVLLGLARANLIQPEDIADMNKDPMVFAMSNPVPEIMPEVAKAARADVLMATGRSDYPNQINNVLGFPYIFKGALRVRASCINEEMKLAAAHSLAELARFDVPHELSVMFGKDLHFGREYLIPSAFDPRLNEFVSGAIAKAAVESKVSRLEL
nr:malate dehydrogenase [Helicobacter sp.]